MGKFVKPLEENQKKETGRRRKGIFWTTLGTAISLRLRGAASSLIEGRKRGKKEKRKRKEREMTEKGKRKEIDTKRIILNHFGEPIFNYPIGGCLRR